MQRSGHNICLLAAAAFLATSAPADILNFHGKVVMEDGSPPGRLVGIERKCGGEVPVREANASSKTGEYFVRLFVSEYGGVFSGGYQNIGTLICYLEAVAPGFVSTRIDLSDRRIAIDPELPNLVLSPKPAGALVELSESTAVPRAAKKSWEQAVKYLSARDWTEAETALRAVTAAAPDFGPAWSALGAACRNQQKHGDARKALERAIELDPKRLPLYLALTSVEVDLKDWPAALKTSETLIQADTAHTYLEAYLQNAVARFEQKDIAGALDRMNRLAQLDKRGELPRAEYIWGMILEARGELDAAAAHMRKYLDEHPRARDAAIVADRLANLGKQQPQEDLAAEVNAADLRIGAAGEAPVPGGIKAFSAIARIPWTPTYRDFFLEYCRALLNGSATVASPTAEVSEDIRTFVSTMAEFERLGEREGDRITIRLALDTAEQREKTARAVALLGWRLIQNGSAFDLELGGQGIDGARQRIPAAFGIDELRLRDAIVSRRPFEFEIPIESALLVGGAAWSATLKDKGQEARARAPTVHRPIDIFLHDWRFARAYAGLAAMETETAAAVVSAVGLVPLIARYSGLLYDYGNAFSISGDHAAVPGGAKAEMVWARLAGANPKNPAAFFRALLEKDNGVLLAFFSELSRADAAHQQFFTATPARAQALYNRYLNSDATAMPVKGALSRIPLPDARGSEVVSDAMLLEARLGRPVDPNSAALLAQHNQAWRHLYPYFEKLPGLGAPQFRALAGFADRAAAAAPAERAVLIGEWHALVELIVLGSEAGSLNSAHAAAAFGRACDALRSNNPSAKAIETVRELAGQPADVDEAIPTGLLRLTGSTRDAFERVKLLQRVPQFASLGNPPDPARTLAALSGVVYAALLDPARLLVAEDPLLLAKHDFLPDPDSLFADSALVISNRTPGSHLAGGFGRFREVSARQPLLPSPVDDAAASDTFVPELRPSAADGGAGPALASFTPPPDAPVFHAAGRIVEVYATVTDNRGRYVDDLNGNQFNIHVEGQPTGLFAFENHTASVSVALLFDTTGSMSATLPSLKGAAMKLVDELRPGDSVAVYGFNDNVTEFQSFTTDKIAMKRAVLRAHAAGPTALYDALVRVNRDLAQRHGKKVIILFSDGDDNASMLTADAAILRAKSRGIPIYTIAQGEALLHPRLVAQLANLSQFTGGTPFIIRKLEDIGAAFARMSEDLMHGYLLAFQPPPDDGNHAWHKIAVGVPGRKGLVIRAREAYFSE